MPEPTEQTSKPRGENSGVVLQGKPSRAWRVIAYGGAALATLALLAFWFGPRIIRTVIRSNTPEVTIDAWKREFREIDGRPHSRDEERRRQELCHLLAKRGVFVDPGLSGDEMENRSGLWAGTVLKWREWEDLFR